MAKKTEQVVPEIIDSVERLNANDGSNARGSEGICNLHTGAGR